MSERVTLAEVARTAGVSTATVSKVLNGRADVSDATRARVQEVLQRNGYRKRRAAGRRPEERTRTAGFVDFVISTLATPWSCEVLRGAEEEAHRAGVGLVVTVTQDPQAGAHEWLDGISSRRSEGVVLVLSRLQSDAAARLAALHIPLVLVDPVGGSQPDVPTIGATNWAGGLMATEHLLELGHRRIGIIPGPDSLVCSRERLDGYRAAFGRAGLPVDETLIYWGNFYSDGGQRGAAEMLDMDDPPTAIFAGSDLQATGVYSEAHARNIRIPQQLSVVGFDDVIICKWLTPRLTTVRQPLIEMGRLAMRTVLDQAAGRAGTPLRVEMATSLVVRESTAQLVPAAVPAAV